MAAAGFRNAELCETFDSFLETSKENIARKFRVMGANFVAYK